MIGKGPCFIAMLFTFLCLMDAILNGLKIAVGKVNPTRNE